MILVDVNLLIYAIDRDSPQHPKAKAWLEETLSGTVTVCLPWLVLLAFIRLTTRSGVVRNPLTAEQAFAYVDSWLEQPFIVTAGPGERHWRILRNLLAASGTAGNLTSDAHLAALALEHGFAIYSSDNDFKRFAGVRHVNPLH